VVVKQGFEPPNFTGFFGAWDPELFEVSLELSPTFKTLCNDDLMSKNQRGVF
jgi:hypothetical protein